MRVSKEKAAENRERILDESARLFRERGLSAVGVDALAEAAGLTYGSLYSHFDSKETLTVEAIRHAFGGFAGRMSRYDTLSAYVKHYLSKEHRDGPGGGCSLAALGCEMPRQSAPVRHAFTEGIKGVVARLAARIPGGGSARKRETEALNLIATLAGTLILARAVSDPELSDRILEAGRARLRALEI